MQPHWWMHVTLLGNECNFTGALSNAFTPFCLESTGRRGDFHTDLWSWAGFWAVLHGFRFWRAGLRLPFLGLFLSTGGSSWGAHGGVWSLLWQLQLVILFIVNLNLLCALMGEQPRNSWLCNKISCPLVTATDRIQNQQPASQGEAQVSTNVPCSTDRTPELSLATEMSSSLYKMNKNEPYLQWTQTCQTFTKHVHYPLNINININSFVKALSGMSSNYPSPSGAVGWSCTEQGAALKSPEWRWEGRFFLFEAGIVGVLETGGWTALFDCDTGLPNPSPGPARREQGEE